MHRARIYTYFLMIAFILTFVGSGASYAADDAQAKDSKQAFIKAWEDNIKAMPTTVIFEKTAEKDVYNFETTLFPYKGKLKVLNVFIDKKMSYYYDYDEDTGDVLKGVAEIALDQTEDELSQKYQQSYSALSRQMYLFFEPETKRWMNTTEFSAFRKTQAEKEPKQTPSSAAKKSKPNPLIEILSPFILLIPLFIFLWSVSRRQKKCVNKSLEIQELSVKKQELAMERQLEAIDICKKSYDLQKEQVELLRKILEKQDQS